MFVTHKYLYPNPAFDGFSKSPTATLNLSQGQFEVLIFPFFVTLQSSVNDVAF